MSNDTSMNIEKSVAYGAKLKTAREAMGLEQKDIAAQLRLGERIIEMLESGHYAADVPTTFVRGYIRSYSKLLQIPEADIAEALEPIKPTPTAQEPIIALANKQSGDVTSSNYYMQFSTYAIAATLTGMIGLWWYNHTPSQMSTIAQSQMLDVQDVQKAQDNKQVAALSTGAMSTNTATTSNVPAGATVVAAATPTNPSPAATPATTPAKDTGVKPGKKQIRDDDDEDDEDDGQ